MKQKISEMLCGMEELTELPAYTAISAERVQELVGEKIGRKRHGFRRPVGILAVAALCAVMCVAAYAGGLLMKAQHDLSRFTGEDVGEAVEQRRLDNGIQNGITQFFFGRDKIAAYYENGDIMWMDDRTVTDEEYRPNMTAEEAVAYADRVERIAPDVLDALHEKGYVKGDSSGVECCFCNDFAGSDTIFNGGTAWVDVLMKDGSAYALLLDPEDLSSRGFLYFDAETAPKMYDGVYTAMHNGTLEQYWYDLQNGDGLG